MPLPEWLEYLDHTADEGVRVHGPTRAAVLERAAWGMFSLLTELSEIRAETCVRIEVSAEDNLSLLVKWLSKLNVLHQTDHVLLSRFEVQQLRGCALQAAVWGEIYDPKRHELLTEIKAVTFCDAQLHRSENRWVAQVVFDV